MARKPQFYVFLKAKRYLLSQAGKPQYSEVLQRWQKKKKIRDSTVALTGSNQKFVKYFSNISVNTGATAKNSASIAAQVISCGGKSISSGTGTISGVESGSVVWQATDSRGFTTQQTRTYDLVEYIKLTCTLNASAATTSGVATLKISGNYWNGNFGAANNTLTVQYRYKVKDGIFSLLYPVGSVYISVNNTNPSTLFGGTWEQIKDKFLIAAGSTYAGGSTGGEATHTLTNSEMPSHNHGIFYPNAGAGNNYAPIGYPNVGSKSTYWAVGSYTGDVGGGEAHNNMPPYLAVYVWKRTK